jgi:hypothetical protein
MFETCLPPMDPGRTSTIVVQATSPGTLSIVSQVTARRRRLPRAKTPYYASVRFRVRLFTSNNISFAFNSLIFQKRGDGVAIALLQHTLRRRQA